MEVFEMPAKVSWTTILGDMEIGGKLKVPEAVGRKTIAPRISREVKLKYPDQEYTTDSKTEKGYTIIERTK